jgi:hypothetical protein
MRGSVIRNTGKAAKSRTPLLAAEARRKKIAAVIADDIMEFGQDECLHCGDPEREIEPDSPEIKRSDRGDAICDKCGEPRETFDYRDLEEHPDYAADQMIDCRDYTV